VTYLSSSLVLNELCLVLSGEEYGWPKGFALDGFLCHIKRTSIDFLLHSHSLYGVLS